MKILSSFSTTKTKSIIPSSEISKNAEYNWLYYFVSLNYVGQNLLKALLENYLPAKEQIFWSEHG
jgi:hypothetical protein